MVFEVDEATVPQAAEAIRPRALVLTNVFRDQLDRYGEVDKIFTFWRKVDVFPPGPLEDARMHTRFVIPDAAGKAIGRLHFDLQPAIRTSDNQPMYVLHLTARGQLGDGIEFLDVGRDWIVRTFKALTTDSMHKVWRIKTDA